MDLDSATPPAKRSRAKAKTPTTEATPAVSTRSRKSKKAAAPQAQPDVEVTSVTALVAPDGEVLATMVATAAYYLAEQRNFEPGHELDDWLEAERQVRALYG